MGSLCMHKPQGTLLSTWIVKCCGREPKQKRTTRDGVAGEGQYLLAGQTAGDVEEGQDEGDKNE